MKNKMKIFWKFLVIVTLMICQSKSESVDNGESYALGRFCYPYALANTRKSCECNSFDGEPWGMQAMNIDCSYKGLKNKDFTEMLPPFTQNLDLSWNSLESVPFFSSNSLFVLNLRHNNISSVVAKNFGKLSNIRELYLNWNSIQVIEANAFEGLAHLRVLDLSHNNLHNLPDMLFGPAAMLEFLSLSWNRQLNQSLGFYETDFYSTFGVSVKLQTLKLQACGLNTIILNENAPLKELDLRHNSFTDIPEKLPKLLQKLDMSRNLLTSLNPNHTQKCLNIKELYFEDMLYLERVEADTFTATKNLKKLSFQNSQSLSHFDEYAFEPSNTQPELKEIIFRGTAIRTLNDTLYHRFNGAEKINFNGMPLDCDCHLYWVAQLNTDTQGRCRKPYRLRNYLVKSLRQSDFKCDNGWPRWLYGVMIFGLIILCSAGIYFIVIGLRPSRKVTMRPKVGAGSPYARITIEPNQQEHT